ncbi:MAG: helix-turn-helix transcriptional regulator [Flavobacteriales bacterium]|nr:helix-turn-helix transcriptional regulator [Flavobacteriales bacterium]MBP6696808.1 helix-turn-helix transcriptional regulator [Flavobacteriales bacterium]
MKLFMQNMFSLRCKMLVVLELRQLGFEYSIAELEAADLETIAPEVKYAILTSALRKYNIVLKGEERAMLLDKLKYAIIEVIYRSDGMPQTRLSVYLSEQMKYNYCYLSSLFSHAHGYTLEHFIIEHKIERVKQLLAARGLTLSEIAWQLHYSSVAHLSNQFKKIVGVTPSGFRTAVHMRHSAFPGVPEPAPAYIGHHATQIAGVQTGQRNGHDMSG